MSDFTPTTSAVRGAYISSMRDKLAVSADEAGAEFDRWLTAAQCEYFATLRKIDPSPEMERVIREAARAFVRRSALEAARDAS